MAQYSAKCQQCSTKSEPTLHADEAVAQAQRQGFKLIGGKWYCESCAKEKSAVSPKSV